ncbi:MAG: hypothetical protein PF541_00750 [Prolixibacteraceae bacterium]|nr:hypothetical protein [Prolixibacteraceae bacterium]
MKTLITLLIAFSLTFGVYAQSDSTQIVNDEFNELIEEIEEVDQSIVEIDEALEAVEAEKAEMTENDEKDTVHVRIGNHRVEIISGDKDANIDIEKIDEFESKWNDYDWEIDHFETVHPKRKRDFDGHWAGFDFGGNQLLTTKTSYSMYPEGTPKFLDTRPEKSFEFNFNFAEYSFGFGNYIGIVTGLGLNFNDYKFKNKYTLVKDDNGMIQAETLPEEDFRKSKLSTVFLTAPLLLEFQIPGNQGHDRLFIAGGLIGGVKLGEHTKTKIGDNKVKDKGDFNISPLRWGYTARIGFEDMGIYATYYNTPLFEDGKGPTTTPLTIGLTFTF